MCFLLVTHPEKNRQSNMIERKRFIFAQSSFRGTNRIKINQKNQLIHPLCLQPSKNFFCSAEMVQVPYSDLNSWAGYRGYLACSLPLVTAPRPERYHDIRENQIIGRTSSVGTASNSRIMPAIVGIPTSGLPERQDISRPDYECLITVAMSSREYLGIEGFTRKFQA